MSSAGTPVVVGALGGAREIVDGHAVGAVAASQHPADLAAAAEHAMDASPATCRARAAAFSPEIFQRQVHAWVAQDPGGPADHGVVPTPKVGEGT